MLKSIFGLDIGTSNIKIYSSDSNTFLNEKNIIAIAKKKKIFSFGDEAFEMHEKAPEYIQVSGLCQYEDSCGRVYKKTQ